MKQGKGVSPGKEDVQVTFVITFPLLGTKGVWVSPCGETEVGNTVGIEVLQERIHP